MTPYALLALVSIIWNFVQLFVFWSGHINVNTTYDSTKCWLQKSCLGSMIGWFIGGLNTCVSIPECKLLHKISAIIISYCSRPTGKRSLVPHYSNATGIDCCSGTATFASTNNYNCDWWEWESPNLKHIMLSSIKLNRHLASGLMQGLFLAAKTFLTRWVSRTEGFLRFKDCPLNSLIH